MKEENNKLKSLLRWAQEQRDMVYNQRLNIRLNRTPEEYHALISSLMLQEHGRVTMGDSDRFIKIMSK